METSIEKLTAELHETFSKNQFDKTLEFVADDIIAESYALGATFKGKDAFMQFMMGFKSAFPDMQLQHNNLIINGNRVAVEFTAQGTHTGDLQTPNGVIPATGKPVHLMVSEFMTWEGGKLKSLHNYQDVATLLRQIGVM